MATFNPFKDLLMNYTTDAIASRQSELHKATVEGKIEDVKTYINSGNYQINQEDPYGRTPLYMAVQNDYPEIVRLLIEHGASVNPPNCQPLAIARHTEMAKCLILSGANINAFDLGGNTALHNLTNGKLAQYFIEIGADVTLRNCSGMNPLHSACKKSCDNEFENIALLLIEHGCPVNEKDNLKRSALHLACEHRAFRLICLLIKHGANLNEIDFKGMCPIHYFLEQFSHLRDNEFEEYMFVLYKLLGDSDINVACIDAAGKTPLHYSAEQTSKEIVSVLIEKGADPNVVDAFGRTPLHLCHNAEICEALILGGSCLNATDMWGQSTLHLAVEKRDIQLVSSLLKAKANVGKCDKNGWTTIHTGAAEGMTDILQLLLSSYEGINETDKQSNTPLHLASWNGHVDTVKVLLENQADISLKDNNGRTALQTAAYRSVEVYNILSEKSGMHEPPLLCKFSSYGNSLISGEEFEAIIQQNGNIKRSHVNIETYLANLLATPTIGLLGEGDEEQEIEEAVYTLVKNIVEGINTEDGRFQCKLLHVGSVSEGTKVRCPNEFDFVLCLEKFSECCFPKYTDVDSKYQISTNFPMSRTQTANRLSQSAETETLEVSISGYTSIYCTDKNFSELVAEFAEKGSGLLPCVETNYLFSQILSLVIHSNAFPKDERLIIKEVTMHPKVNIIWRGCQYKNLEIQIDLVPAIKLASWPPKAVKNSVLITKDMMEIPSVVVPKMTSADDEDLWRCSMVLLEVAIFRRLLPRVKHSFIAVKALLQSCVCPIVNFGLTEDELFYFKSYENILEEKELELYRNIEALLPTYPVKMLFLKAIEDLAEMNGIHTVYQMDTGCSNVTRDIDATYHQNHSYGPAETKNTPLVCDDLDISLVKYVFCLLEKGMSDKFVQSFFNQRQNVLNSNLLSGDTEKVHKYVKYILKLLE